LFTHTLENQFRKLAKIECDSTGTILRFNEIAENIFGYMADEVVRDNIACLVPDAFAERHRERLSNTSASKAAISKILGKHRNVQAKRKSGDLFEAQIRVEPVCFQGCSWAVSHPFV